ncbi:hypothetical protein HELRODRAFT_165177 [Helobdella robusta]|uniref:Uncharacterized protein n=1 Tax=Helobdella robusta TaxID=6412 RepID=T1EWD9_HELRO|nr:hypothetical protein HELRODRAFT_165177 [Helobdella robusta]ESN93022.1 hypothetical protein HELRODRAFT_165177 [Helobdella robusta]
MAEWLACSSTTPTTRVRILQFLQIHPGSRPPVNPAVHPFEVGKWVDDVSCCMLTGEMARWFKCSLSQTQMLAESNISMAIIYSAYMMRCLRVHINTCVRRVKRITAFVAKDGCFKSIDEEKKNFIKDI